MNLVLTSERLLLTPLSETDVDIAIELYTDPAVVKYICDPMSEDEIRKEMSYVTKEIKIPETYLRRPDSVMGAEFGPTAKTALTIASAGKNGLN